MVYAEVICDNLSSCATNNAQIQIALACFIASILPLLGIAESVGPRSPWRLIALAFNRDIMNAVTHRTHLKHREKLGCAAPCAQHHDALLLGVSCARLFSCLAHHRGTADTDHSSWREDVHTPDSKPLHTSFMRHE